jgi:hypothetical protein
VSLDPVSALPYWPTHKGAFDFINYTFILSYAFVVFLDMKAPPLLNQEMCPHLIIPHQSYSTITLNRS